MAPENITLATPPEEELATLKTQFLASLNHEVRTPLTGIVGMTDLLLETALSQEQKEYVDAARHCAGDLLALFNKTLDFSDLSSGRVILERHEFHLPEALRNAVSAHVPAAREKGLKLACRLAPDLPETAIGDAVRLGQLVFHMVENAVKFTERGKVEVLAVSQVKDAGLQLNIKVRDTGIGIAPDQLEMVFESFRQLDGGLGRAYGGLGLGLPLVQKLTLLMGGQVLVESEPGIGSEFSVTIPLELV
jgi:two-component system, sensor histidine kinase and response regulator